MIAILAALLMMLSAVPASADCWETIGVLSRSAFQFKPESRPDCNNAPDKEACQATECANWDIIRADFAAEITKGDICAEILANKLPGFMIELETKRVQCNSIQDELVVPVSECRTSLDEVVASLMTLQGIWLGVSCPEPHCSLGCAKFREHEAVVTALTQSCRTKIRRHLDNKSTQIAEDLAEIRVVCTSRGF